MNKVKLILVASIMAAVTSCMEKDDVVVQNQMVEREFIANYSNPTKTSVDYNGTVDWSQGDVINYYTASEGKISKCTINADCHSAKITASVGEYDSFIVAVHGATISNPLAKSMTLTGLFSAEQDGYFGSSHVSICKRYFDDGNTLNFTNISGYIHFSLKKRNVSYVLLTAEDGTKICGDGTATVSFSGDKPTVVFGENGSGNMIKMKANRSGDFYIATLPVIVNGFTLRFYDDTDQLLGAAHSDKKLDLSVGNMVDLGEMDSKINTPEREDLSAAGTANCYIASKSGFPYKFKATVKGNSNESVGEARTVKVLWESFGTDVAPKAGDVVSDVSFADGYINFTAVQNGNAVIQVGDVDGDILWSWHIWVCDGFNPKSSAQVYNNDAGTMMDRNLGATSVTPGDVHTLGLLYQWGRKDPFLGADGFTASANSAKASKPFKDPIDVDNIAGDKIGDRIEYSVKNPTTFLYDNHIYPWWVLSVECWQQQKTIYDPCPSGWKVPEAGVWSKAALNKSGCWNSFNAAYDNYSCTIESLGIGSILYPVCFVCSISGKSGELVKSETLETKVWSSNIYRTDQMSAINFCIYNSSKGFIAIEVPNYGQACGFSVRCIAE